MHSVYEWCYVLIKKLDTYLWYLWLKIKEIYILNCHQSRKDVNKQCLSFLLVS